MPIQQSTQASAYLLALAQRIAAPYVALPTARAAMVMGSATEGLSDHYSDLDMAIYYEELPTEAELSAARESNGGVVKWSLGDREQGTMAEAYLVDGIECQIAHATAAAWERDMDRVLVELDVASPLQKALDGTLHSLPLYGDGLIAAWKSRAASYPHALAEAMVRHHLSFFPLWYLEERFASRDAGLWYRQAMVENAYNVLGVLAGLNRLYFSTFQFKRTGRFIEQMRIAPPELSDRLEALFMPDRREGAAALERLVEELVALVDLHMPQVDTSAAQSQLGRRQERWRLGSLDQLP